MIRGKTGRLALVLAGSLILISDIHAGDIYAASVLDWLEEIAPVYAANGGMDPTGDPRVQKTRILELEGRRLGLIHDYVENVTNRTLFHGPLDLIIHGHTHIVGMEVEDGVPLINPGSTTFPTANSRMDLPGNAGVLELTAQDALIRFYELSSPEPVVVGEHRHLFP